MRVTGQKRRGRRLRGKPWFPPATFGQGSEAGDGSAYSDRSGVFGIGHLCPDDGSVCQSVAYVDTSALTAIAFDEPGAAILARRLDEFTRLVSSNRLEAELRATFARAAQAVLEADAPAETGVVADAAEQALSVAIAGAVAAPMAAKHLQSRLRAPSRPPWPRRRSTSP